MTRRTAWTIVAHGRRGGLRHRHGGGHHRRQGRGQDRTAELEDTRGSGCREHGPDRRTRTPGSPPMPRWPIPRSRGGGGSCGPDPGARLPRRPRGWSSKRYPYGTGSVLDIELERELLVASPSISSSIGRFFRTGAAARTAASRQVRRSHAPRLGDALSWLEFARGVGEPFSSGCGLGSSSLPWLSLMMNSSTGSCTSSVLLQAWRKTP